MMRLSAGILVLALSGGAMADMVSSGTDRTLGDSVTGSAISRLELARQYASTASQRNTASDHIQGQSNVIYYSALTLPSPSNICPDGTPKLGDGITNPGDNGVLCGGGNDGSTGGNDTPLDPTPVPAPGASVLGLLGLACICWARRKLA
jgi:hypothetical protein